MTIKKYPLTRRTLQVFIVFILSALISRSSFAATSDVTTRSEGRNQQCSCYSNM